MRPSRQEKMRVFISGSTGPYGAHFARHCLALGHDVFSLKHHDRPNDSASLLGIADKITWARGDIRDSSLLAHLLASWDVQAIAHFAALPLVKTGMLVAEPIFSVNTGGTVALLDAAKQVIAGGQRLNFLFVSTDKSMGYAGDRPYTEDMPLLGRGVYEASKAAAELACLAYQGQGLVPNLVVTRSCNVVAGADLNWRLCPNTIRQLMCSVPAKIFTRGQYVREFIHVDDAVEGQYLAMMRADEHPGQVFHLGSGISRTQEEVIEYIRDKHFPEGTVIRVEPPAHHRIEIPYQVLDSSKAARVLGWRAKRNFEDMIADLVAWWREHEKLAKWSML